MKNYFLFFLLFLTSVFSSCKEKSSSKSTVVKNRKIVGVDVSHHQDKINWKLMATQKNYKLKFAIVKATEGTDWRDDKFFFNLSEAKKNGLFVGSYHMYNPNKNSKLQAENYLRNSRQQDCDIIPILDIEKISNVQSNKRLLLGVKRWLDYVEKKTGHKPMIYTGLSFYRTHFANKKEFMDYPRWTASYSDKHNEEEEILTSDIHQFSEKIWIKGLSKKNKVDVNVSDSLRFQRILKTFQKNRIVARQTGCFFYLFF